METNKFYNGFLDYFLNKFGIFPKKKLIFNYFLCVESRYRTFYQSNWDEGYVKKDDLADTGFFSIREKDIVACFCCGKMICDWEFKDDPYIEHAKFSPDCLLVSLNKDILNERKEIFNEEANKVVEKWFFHRDREVSDFTSDLQATGYSNADIKYLYYERYNKKKIPFETPDDAICEFKKKKTPEKEVPHPCVICMTREISVVFLKCGHVICCSFCAPCMEKCPLCGCEILGCSKIYLS